MQGSRSPVSHKHLQFERSDNPVEPSRRWLRCGSSQFYPERHLYSVIFTVMSYNILSQELLRRHVYLYRHSPSEALKWEYRSQNIIWEIRRHNVDIVCLQELEELEYNNIFRSQLFQFGYDSIYKKKTGDKTDGCAIFFKKDLFILENDVAVELKRPGEPLLDRDNVGLVALFKPLRIRNENVKFCVSTTHLLFNPKRGDVKLVQLRVLLAEIGKIALKGISSEGAPEYHPVILCGDFNSVPFSPLYNFITSGSICCNNMLTGNVSGQEEGINKGSEMTSKCMDLSSLGINQGCQYMDLLSAASLTCVRNPSALSQPLCSKFINMISKDTSLFDFDASAKKCNSDLLVTSENASFTIHCKTVENHVNEIYHNFNFVSAYKHFALDGGAEVTTCHSKAKDTVDYIFYSKPVKTLHPCKSKRKKTNSLLMALGVYSLFSTVEMDLLGGLPNWAFPSDHTCLITRFALCAS